MTDPASALGVLKYGIGYDLLVVKERSRHVGLDPTPMVLVLAIRCHTCQRVSYHPKDVEERYCGCCHRFHVEEPPGV